MSRAQAFKIAVSVDSNHAESYCNLAALEVRKQVRPEGHKNELSSPSTYVGFLRLFRAANGELVKLLNA